MFYDQDSLASDYFCLPQVVVVCHGVGLAEERSMEYEMSSLRPS